MGKHFVMIATTMNGNTIPGQAPMTNRLMVLEGEENQIEKAFGKISPDESIVKEMKRLSEEMDFTVKTRP